MSTLQRKGTYIVSTYRVLLVPHVPQGAKQAEGWLRSPSGLQTVCVEGSHEVKPQTGPEMPRIPSERKKG